LQRKEGEKMYNYLGDFLVHTLRENLNVMYAQVQRDGELIEEYKRMPVKTRLNLWSVSKGIVASAAGIALDEGLIQLDERIVDIFPEQAAANKQPNLQHVTLEHLLTMTTGLKGPLFFCDGPERYTTKDWIQYFFDKGEFVNEPGKEFLYTNFNTYLLSCAIEKRAGENLLEYLRYRLFEPMGMHNPDWTLCPMGHVHAANGLYFTIDEYSKYGEFLRNKGKVDGQQLVPRAFMEKAMSPLTDLSNTPFASDNGLNGYYGYYFITSKDKKIIHSDGNYGQFCFVFPDQNMVVTVMSLEGSFPKIGEYLLEDVGKRILSA